MIEEIETPNQEEDLKRRVKAKRRIRGLLICINAFLACYLVFEIISKIVDRVSTKVEDSDIIALNGNSRKDSLALYNKYLLKNDDGSYNVDEAFDFGLYGDYLHINKYICDINNYSSYTAISKINVSSKVTNGDDIIHVIEGKFLNGGIKLTSLDKGDYLFFNETININEINSPHQGIKIRSSNGIQQVIYSLPYGNGKRKKIEIKSKDSSPCLVVSVNEVSFLPKEYYDYILIGEKAQEYSHNIPEGESYFIAKNLEEAMTKNANYCFVIDEQIEEITGSNYLSLDIKKDDQYGGDSLISHQDKNPFIRELGGYLTKAGSCIKGDDSTFKVKPYLSLNQKGKMTLLINNQQDFAEIKKLIS